MSGTVSIVLDGEEKIIAAGLKVRNLLTPEEIEQVLRGEMMIVDARGQERGLGGALLAGTTIFRRPRPRAR